MLRMVNLDPACEVFNYPAVVGKNNQYSFCKVSSSDVRDLISVNDVQEDEELILGPNGALVFCME